MEIELYSIIAAVILIATMITALFTLTAYTVFQIRKRRKSPAPATAPAAAAPQFFKRYQAS